MTQATVQRPTRQRRISPFGQYVHRRVSFWQQRYLDRRPDGLEVLARLRRGAGKELSDVPELMAYTLDGIPAEDFQGEGPTRAERAVHTALTLYAVHQQSRRQPMHVPGRSFGAALRELRRRPPSEEAVRRRFEALATAETPAEAVYHARGLITQLRAYDIALDYGTFTDDLIGLQGRGAGRVRLQWGRDFYRTGRPEGGVDDGQTENQAAGAAATDEDE